MKQYQDRDWLYQKYWEEELGALEISKICGVSQGTILNRMEEYGIKSRTNNEAQKIAQNRPEMIKRKKEQVGYWKGKHIPETAIKKRIETIRRIGYPAWNKGLHHSEETKKKISKVRIQGLGMNHKKSWLEQKYIVEKLSLSQIAELAECCHTTIRNWMEIFGIKPRMLSEAQKISNNRPEVKKGKSETSKRMWSCPEYRNKMSGVFKGEKSHFWKGGISFEPYGLEFNKTLKKQIRKRDNYQCQECGVKENGKAHDCHHINYDKQNNEPENLITLCNSCHSKTNSNRQYWQNYFEFQISLKGINQFIEQ